MRCLESIGRSGGASAVIVVDNSEHGIDVPTAVPSDTTGAGPAIEAQVVNTPNRGYGAAANVGFAVARRRFPDQRAVALLNDDTVVTVGWLDPLLRAIDQGAAVAQPKLLFSSPADSDPVVNSVGVELHRGGAGSDIGYGEPDGPAHRVAKDIEIFTGGGIVLSFEFLDATGGFDERFFLYYEDVDLALRGGQLGFRYRCEPSSVVYHEGGATTGGQPDAVSRLQERNRLWCAFRFGGLTDIVGACWLSIKKLRLAPRRAHLAGAAEGVLGGLRRLGERHRRVTTGRP